MAGAWANAWGSSWGSSWGQLAALPNYVRLGWWPCDRCGKDYPEPKLKQEWTGLRVCPSCWDPRHSQDFVRGVPDRQGVRPGMRPEPDPYYLSTNEVTANDL